MTFLTPIALLGLIAAVIPILLHIFNLRKLKIIEFSTLSFLKELQKTKIHRLKLRQLLLLFLRTLLIILVVLAFSRPTLKGSIPGGLAGQAKTTAVILFDDSQSMTASDDQGELIRQARAAAISIVDLMKDGDEIFLVKLSDITTDGISENPSSQRNFSAVRSTINNIKPSFIHRTIEDGIRYCARLLLSSKNFNKEVYIVSDFQSGSLESKLNVSKNTDQLFPPNVQFFLVSLGKRALHNIAIDAVDIPSTIFEVNKPFIVKVKIANYSPSDVKNHIVSVYQDGERIAQKGVDVRAGQSTETEFSLVPRNSGFLQGTIELEDDELGYDNRRCFVVHIPEEIRVLLIGNSADLTYLRLALKTRLSDSSAGIKINETTMNRFSPLELNFTDAAFIADPGGLSISQSSSLKTYLQNGGGIFLLPGSQSTVTGFNSSVTAILGFSVNAAVESQSGIKPSDSFIEFDKVDFRHPIFSGMFEEEKNKSTASALNQRVLESPHIKMSLHFMPSVHSNTIIAMTNSAPFLIDEQSDKGRALLMSVPANVEWSDFPLKGLFVPLIHRAVAYLAQEPTNNHSILVKEERTTSLRSSASQKLTVKQPGGIETSVYSQQVATDKLIHFSNTDIPGFYTILEGNHVVDEFAVNMDPDESNIVPTDGKHREKMLKQLGIANSAVHTTNHLQDIQQTVTESRLGSELWKQFLIAAILIAIIEMIVAGNTKRSLAVTTANTDL